MVVVEAAFFDKFASFWNFVEFEIAEEGSILFDGDFMFEFIEEVDGMFLAEIVDV